MTSSNKWLIGMGGALGVLVLIAVVAAVLTSNDQPDLRPEDTPEGVVQRYVQALIDNDMDMAYTYLSSELKESCALSDWQQQARQPFRLDESQVLLKEVIDYADGDAGVTVTITQFRAPEPFELTPRDSSFDQTFRLKTQDDGSWRFSRLPWPVFRCPIDTRIIEPIPAPVR